MRRSLRDAIVGFSLIGGVVLFSSLTFWLKGLKISSNTWKISANFSDASGLSVGTPVTFRGIQIGNVSKITFTSKDVQANMRINKSDLVLFKPVFAKIQTSSLLGGDAVISLVSEGNSIVNIDALPKSQNCPKDIILCAGDSIKGNDLENISKLTSELNKIISEAEGKEIIKKIVSSIEQFDGTQKNLDELITLSKLELIKAQPIIDELIITVGHVNNILSAIDDPEVISDIRSSADSIQSFTKKLDNITTKFDELINDEDLTNALKDAAIGIGKLFNDIYK